ncbi:MAG TPA: metallophosphoesterase [Bryobacteraceae bacterium]|nr:metallophosphoesterase [Bryobacteraceae bacterium]
MNRFLFLLVPSLIWAQSLTLPNKPDSLKFAIFGDTGTGEKEESDVAAKAVEYQRAFPFKFAILLGDNLYGGEATKDFQNKFERPFKELLDQGVKFYAALGNHDDTKQVNYKLFNMNGERFYSFKPKNGVRFFALDSNYIDPKQFEWLEKELSSSGSDWKICFFHHPLYSSGEKHGPNEELRSVLEPILLKYGVNVVFAGHEHFYERLKPQKGIEHITLGNSAKLRKGNIDRGSGLTAAGFDTDRAFMLAEIDGDTMHFQTISRTGRTVDKGAIKQIKLPAPEGEKPARVVVPVRK